MRYFQLDQLSPADRQALLRRPVIDYTTIFDRIRPILDAVRAEGDTALRRFTQEFDRVELGPVMYTVRKPDEIALPETVKTAFITAFENIRTFHSAQIPATLEIETMPGVICRRVVRAIPRVGLYVPGGTAVLPSSVLMLGIPASLAGCSEILIATPPRPDGSVAPEVEFAAALCGIRQILLAGGAQAVAAMAFGTESVPKVDKILGPGNQYVTAAKMLLQNSDAMISIDMPAGPSEVLIIADQTANPAYIAADLLSQAEHGTDSQVVLVATSGFDMDALRRELDLQCLALPRAEIAAKALQNSYAVVSDDRDALLDFTNDYAPEHLIINTADADVLTERIQTAGSVFVGPFTPESVGDYASGTNHTLPTYGYARMYSGVSIDSFIRQMTVQQLTADGLRRLGPHVEVMARTEGLAAHERAVSIRLRDLSALDEPLNLE